MLEYPSQTIKEAVEAFATLPGIGKKTALRLAMHLLRQEEAQSERLGNAIISLRKNVKFCQRCHNLSDDALCKVCQSSRRDQSIICVVEDAKDVMAIENTHQYNGLYHVLGGIINPLQGIGPSQLNIESLLERAREEEVKEIVFAFSSNIEGDTTLFYLSKKLTPLGVQISSIARGIPVGYELEYTDEITLGRSLMNRTQLQFSQDE